jgi:hypothetical protein
MGNMMMKTAMTRRECERVIPHVVEWCRTNMPRGRKRYYPTVEVERWNAEWYEKGEVGYYTQDGASSEIHIAYDRLHSVHSLIRTVIHEWTHYIQPAKVLLAMHSGDDYRSHPCEVQAFENESRYTDACWNDIKAKI